MARPVENLLPWEIMQTVPPVGYTLLDRYLVEAIIDVGGDTAILKTMDTRLDVCGAVKFLLGDDTASDWEIRRENFIRSFRAMARLNHPNIVHVANIETRCGLTFSVMEELQGETLQTFIDAGGTLEPKEVIELFLGVVDAVAMAHSSDILHRRLSPSQIFLNRQGKRISPRVLNFLSFKNTKLLDPVRALPFLSPEQFDDFGRATPASDIFSLCATLYCVFAQQPPVIFPRIEDYKAFYAQSPGIEVFPDSVPKEFVPILKQGLQTAPNARKLTAATLVQALKHLASDMLLSANLSLDASIASRQKTPSQPFLPPKRRTLTGAPIPNEAPIHTSQTTASQNIAVSPEFTAQTPYSTPNPPPAGAISEKQARQHCSNPHLPPLPAAAHTSASGLRAVVPGAHPAIKIALPPSLEQIYRLRDVIHADAHAILAAVSTHDNDSEIYILKRFCAKNETEQAIFNEGVRRSDILAHECPYIQSIFQPYPDECAFIMPDIERQPLPDSIRKTGPYAPNVVTQIGILLAQTMDSAHQHGYVNGNIKPSNIIFENRNGITAPVIYDFGQSLYVESLVDMRPENIPFSAPELDYNLQHANAQADIFAFGMCLVFMLIGRLPYSKTDVAGLVAEIDACDEIPDISAFRKDIPGDLLKIIHWCTAFDPASRYVHFCDVVRDLRVVHQQLTTSA